MIALYITLAVLAYAAIASVVGGWLVAMHPDTAEIEVFWFSALWPVMGAVVPMLWGMRWLGWRTRDYVIRRSQQADLPKTNLPKATAKEKKQ